MDAFITVTHSGLGNLANPLAQRPVILRRAIVITCAANARNTASPTDPNAVGRLWLNDGSCVRLRPSYKDHVWSYDFVHCRTHEGRAFRLLVILDVYSRECLALDVARNLRGDNGSEFTANAVRAWLSAFDVKTFFISPRHRIDKIGQQAVGGGAGAEVFLDER